MREGGGGGWGGRAFFSAVAELEATREAAREATREGEAAREAVAVAGVLLLRVARHVLAAIVPVRGEWGEWGE